MKVREFMTRDVESVEPGLSLLDAAHRMRVYAIGALPVCAAGRVVGMLTDRDIVTRAVAVDADVEKTRVKDVMSREPVCCREDQEISEAAGIMERKKVRRLPVIDEDGELAGILSLDDFPRRWEGRFMTAEVLEAVARR